MSFEPVALPCPGSARTFRDDGLRRRVSRLSTPTGKACERELPIGICQLESKIDTAAIDPRPDNLERALEVIAKTAEQGRSCSSSANLPTATRRTSTPLYTRSRRPTATRTSSVSRRRRRLATSTSSWARRPQRLVSGAGVQLRASDRPRGPDRHVQQDPRRIVALDGKSQPRRRGGAPASTFPYSTRHSGGSESRPVTTNSFPEVSRTLTLKGARSSSTSRPPSAGSKTTGRSICTFARPRTSSGSSTSPSSGLQRNFECFGGSRLLESSRRSRLRSSARRGGDRQLRAPTSTLYTARGHWRRLHRNPLYASDRRHSGGETVPEVIAEYVDRLCTSR